MSYTVVVQATTKDFEVSVERKMQGYRVSVTGQPDQNVLSPSATFVDMVAGDYTASVSLMDDQGQVVGDTQSAQFNLAVQTQMVQVPDVVTVQVS